jgi:carboxypeptidase C (cathepsin A)
VKPRGNALLFEFVGRLAGVHVPASSAQTMPAGNKPGRVTRGWSTLAMAGIVFAAVPLTRAQSARVITKLDSVGAQVIKTGPSAVFGDQTLGFPSGSAQVGGANGPETAVRHGKASVRGKVIPYRVETGEMIMRNPAGTPRATVFAVSYLAENARGASRPVTFIFNGGPGAASWMLREAISPKVIVRAAAAPGFAFANNRDSLIDISDLVFIDAPGTGYSRFLAEDAKPEYWGIEQDGRAVAQFIADWLQDHNRGGSPKFILGESYGGTRTGQIVKMLAARQGGAIHFHGVVLVSPSVGTGVGDSVANRAATVLPSEAATAWHYGRGAYTSSSLEQVASDAQEFAAGPYAVAIGQVDKLDREGKAKIAQQVSAFIGLPVDTVLEGNLMVPLAKFRDLLLADKGERIGLDGRVHYPKPAAGQADSIISTAEGYDLHAAITSLLRDELGYKPVGPYVRDPVEANRAWNNTITSEPSSLPDILRATAAADPHFHVLLGGGYFDLVVPYFLPLRALAAADLPPRQLVHRVYPSEHGFLNDPANRAGATDDIRAFYRQAVSSGKGQ